MKTLVAGIAVSLVVWSGITWTSAPTSGSAELSPVLAASARTSLSVSGVVPAPNFVGAHAADPIVLTLREALDPDAFDPSALSVFGRWSGVAVGAVTLDASGHEIRFAQSEPFQAGEAVTVTLRKGLRAASGATMTTGFTWSFWIETTSGSFDMIDRGERMVMEEDERHVQPYGAYAGDFNGDGYSDLAIPNEVSADVRIMLNDGAGNYEEFQVLDMPGGEWPSPNEGADFNGDGHIDFVVGNAGNDLVTVFVGDGAGGFRVLGNYSAGRQVRGVCILDLNSDGLPDVATANMGDGSDRSRRGTVSLLINDGSGRLERTVTIDSPGRGEKTCATGDANGDGLMDLFVGAFYSEEVLLFTGDGQGNLEFASAFPAGGSPWMIVAADLSGDGNLDVLAANREGNNVAVLLGDGSGGLAPPVTYRVGREPMAVDVGDLDGDGDLDVVTSEFSGGGFTIHENAGNGTLINPRVLAALESGSCVVLHDRDRDGDLDITGVDELADRIFLFENPGS